MATNKQQTHSVWWATALIGLFLAVAAFTVHTPAITNSLINSDTLYLAAFYRDLFVDHYDISYWNLTPAPYFFPDMALMFPLMATIGPNIALAYVAYTGCWLGLTTLAMCYIARQIAASHLQAAACGLTATAFFLGILSRENYALAAHQLLSVAHHGGAFMAGLWILGLVLGGLRNGFGCARLLSLVILVAFTAASDFLLVLWFVLPIMIAIGGYALLGWIQWRAALLLLAALLLGLATTYLLIFLINYQELFSWKFQWLNGENNTWQFLTDPKLLAAWWTMSTTLSAPSLLWLACLLILLYILMAEVLRANNRPNMRLWVLLATIAIGSSSAAVLAPIAKGWHWQHTLRYLYPLYLLPALSIFIALAMLPARLKWLAGIPLLGTLAWTASEVLPRFDPTSLWDIAQPYPERISCADQFLRENSSYYGYAFNHWENEYFSELSQIGARANLVGPDFMPVHFNNNRAWYHTVRNGHYGDYPDYRFVLVQSEGDQLLHRFGEPRVVRSCDKFSVWLYDRPADLAFRQRLRIPASLGRMAEADGSPLYFLETVVPPLPTTPHASGILCAGGHNHYTTDGTAATAANSQVFSVDSPLRLAFEVPPGRQVIELALLGKQTYTASFWREGDRVGKLIVPASHQGGLQTRYLHLPIGVVKLGFDHMTVLLDGNHPQASAGYICVYRDSYGTH